MNDIPFVPSTYDWIIIVSGIIVFGLVIVGLVAVGVSRLVRFVGWKTLGIWVGLSIIISLCAISILWR